jgi:hypothetical protein
MSTYYLPLRTDCQYNLRLNLALSLVPCVEHSLKVALSNKGALLLGARLTRALAPCISCSRK